MSLYHKYRPNTLEAVHGNEVVRQAIAGLFTDREQFPHAILFHGPTGCGKTTLARIVAKDLGVIGLDYREVDSADFRGIDTIRDIRKKADLMPLEGPCRVWVIDECHKLTNDAQNAFLKILEDPPTHAFFVLCTTDPDKLLGTIKGRCAQFQVSLLSENQMMRLLRTVCKEEEETLNRQIYEQIIQDSGGHPRNALQILEQVLRVPEENRLEAAKKAAEERSQVIELCRALMNRSGWKNVSAILRGLADQDPESVRRAVLGYCQAVLLKGSNPMAALVMENFIEPFYNSGRPGLVYACYNVVEGE